MPKTKAERLAEQRERTNWLALEIAVDQMRAAVRARDKDAASLEHEAMEELIAQLRGPDGSGGQATDKD